MKKEESVVGNAEPTSAKAKCASAKAKRASAKAKRASAKGCAAGQSGAFEQSECASSKGERARHNIAPVFDGNSRTLILGSFPSVASRESGFYYGHKHNRFWQVLAAVYGEKVPASIDEKRRFLLRNEIALWDVIADCRIVGSSVSSITEMHMNNVQGLLSKARVSRIFANGATAKRLYDEHLFPLVGIEAVRLPSTSPANAAFGLDRLIECWRAVRPD